MINVSLVGADTTRPRILTGTGYGHTGSYTLNTSRLLPLLVHVAEGACNGQAAAGEVLITEQSQ